MLTQTQDKMLSDVSEVMGLQKQDLYDMIRAESGWNPKIKNKQGAEFYGLLQFGKDAARGMRYIDSNGSINNYQSGKQVIDINPTIESQLKLEDRGNLKSPKNGPVVQYLANTGINRLSSPTIYDLVAAVFMPAAMGKPTNIPLYTFLRPDLKEKFIKQNPGIITIEDYVAKMGLRSKPSRRSSDNVADIGQAEGHGGAGDDSAVKAEDKKGSNVIGNVMKVGTIMAATIGNVDNGLRSKPREDQATEKGTDVSDIIKSTGIDPDADIDVVPSQKDIDDHIKEVMKYV